MQPQTKLNDAIELANQMGRLDLSEFKYAQLLRDGKNLIQKDPASGYFLQAIAHRLAGNIKAGLDTIQKAYKLDKSLSEGFYINILMMNGCFEECETIALKKLERDPTHRETFKFLIRTISNTFNISTLEKALGIFKSNTDEDKLLVTEALRMKEEIPDSIKVIESAGSSLDVYRHLLAIANKVSNVKTHTQSKLIITNEETELGKYARVSIKMAWVSINDCIELNDDYVNIISNDTKYSYDEYQKLMLNFEPINMYESVEL